MFAVDVLWKRYGLLVRRNAHALLWLSFWLASAASRAAAQENSTELAQNATATAEPAPEVTSPAAETPPEAALPPPIRSTRKVVLPGPESPPTAATTEPLPEWLRHIKLGAGAILYYYQPLKKNQDNNLSFFYGRIITDVDAGPFGFHIEARFRDGKLRPFFEGPAWIEEGYASWALAPFATLKLGKQYSRLGLFWNNSFYGNVQVYDGLKLAPDYGAAIEGSIGDRFGLNYWVQFFLVDGRTNVSLANRDTVSVPDARRRNEVVVNVEPFIKLSDDAVLRVGLSLQHLQADLPRDKQNVLRLAAHAKLTVAGFGLWGELLHQNGRHVTDFPYAGVPATADAAAVPGRASGDNTYFEVGAEYTLGIVTLRYNVSRASYADLDVSELMNVPAVAVKIADPLTLLAEVVFWRRHTPQGDSDVDRSLNVTLRANY
jgi:hypothetical protein